MGIRYGFIQGARIPGAVRRHRSALVGAWTCLEFWDFAFPEEGRRALQTQVVQSFHTIVPHLFPAHVTVVHSMARAGPHHQGAIVGHGQTPRDQT